MCVCVKEKGKKKKAFNYFRLREPSFTPSSRWWLSYFLATLADDGDASDSPQTETQSQ
jgi:hypothetical protein